MQDINFVNDANTIEWPMMKDEQACFLSALSGQKFYGHSMKPSCHDAIAQYRIDRQVRVGKPYYTH